MSMQTLKEHFFQDPMWHEVEELILSYIEPLKDMGTVDTTQPAEHVKAEIMGRTMAYNNLARFLSDSQIVGRKLAEIKTIFK